MQHPGHEPASARHVPALDGVRGLAILVVLVDNSSFAQQAGNDLLLKVVHALAPTGWIGVQVFFVLSGFLITGILADSLGEPRFFRNFYIRRTLRIFPLYYAVLIVTFFVVPLVVHLPEWAAVAHRNQWWYWLYAANWGQPFGNEIPGLPHFWSLAVEEQFYLAWPLLVFLLARRRVVGLCVLIIAVTPLIRLALNLLGLPPQTAYQFTIARWDALATGALLALLIRDVPGRTWLTHRARTVAVWCAAGLGALVLYEHGFHEDDLMVQVVGQTLIALLSAWLIYASVAPTTGVEHHVRKVMALPWLRFFGKYSYAIYVFHFPIQKVLSVYATNGLNTGSGGEKLLKLGAYLALVLTLSTAAALVSWRVLEKPCLDLKNRLAPRQQVA